MLGKRPRPLQPISSTSLLMPHDPLECIPAAFEKPKPTFGAGPRQIIGFEVANKSIDSGGSPRSVLEAKALSGIGRVASQEKSPRSPRSGLLESLISSPRWEKKGSEGVGLGIVAAMLAEEQQDATGDRAAIEVAKGSAALLASSKCCSNGSITQSQPIAIPATSRGSKENRLSNVVQEEVSSWGAQSRSHGLDLEGVVIGNRNSIFSTGSPASSCNEIPAMDFLSACFFCHRPLAPGKDIYMYRGDRAFCTAECRYQQIVIDERKERCAAAALKSGATAATEATSHRKGPLGATTAAAA